jgi:hypothetical protein
MKQRNSTPSAFKSKGSVSYFMGITSWVTFTIELKSQNNS